MNAVKKIVSVFFTAVSPTLNRVTRTEQMFNSFLMNEWMNDYVIYGAWMEVYCVFISKMWLLHLNGSSEIPGRNTRTTQRLLLDWILSTAVLGNCWFPTNGGKYLWAEWPWLFNWNEIEVVCHFFFIIYWVPDTVKLFIHIICPIYFLWRSLD